MLKFSIVICKLVNLFIEWREEKRQPGRFYFLPLFSQAVVGGSISIDYP